MLFLGVDGDELADQGARPVIERYVTSYAGAFELVLAAITQRAVYMIVAGDQHGVFTALTAVNNSFGEFYILKGGQGLILLDDLLGWDPLVDQVACHRLGFGDFFVRAFAAGGDHDRRGGIFLIDLDRLIQSVGEELGDAVAVQQSGAVDDHIVKIPFARNDLEKNAVDHKHQEAHRDIDDRNAQDHTDTADPAQGTLGDPVSAAECRDQYDDQRRDLAEGDDDPEEQR